MAQPESNRFIKILIIVTFFILLFGLGWALKSIWSTLTALDTRLAASLIAGSSTVIVATLSVVLGKYFERQKEIESHFRETKSEMYDEFIKVIFGLFSNDGNIEYEGGLTKILEEWQRKIVIWGGPSVITSYIKWKNHLVNFDPDAESIFLMGDLVLSIRKDLGLSNKGLTRKSFSPLVLRNANIFLNMAAENPSVKLSELEKKEKELGLATD